MTLRQLVEDASDKVSTFKNPNIDEAQTKLHEICMAAGIGGLIDDTVTSIHLTKDKVSVYTSYSVRCCAQTGHFEFPAAILDSADPIREAKIWGLTQKRDKALAQVSWDEKTLEGSRKRLAEAEQNLKAIGVEQ